MANSISVSEARQDFAEVVNRVAYDNERVTVMRRGRNLVAIVPMSDVLLLEAIEDELDLTAVRAALGDADGAVRIPWTKLRAKLARKMTERDDSAPAPWRPAELDRSAARREA